MDRWRKRTFLGYRRSDGQVGTRNYWLVVPLVFCENKNIEVLKQAFEEELGFAAPQLYRQQVADLVKTLSRGRRKTDRTLLPCQSLIPRSAAQCLRISTASGFCCMRAGAAGPGKIPTISAG